MNQIYNTIREDIKKSMKEKNGETTTLRSIDSAIQLKAKNLKVDITDDIVLDVVSKGLKQRQDSIDAFAKGNRMDLIQIEMQEMLIIERYLPEQLSDADIEVIILESIIETDAKTIKDMGKVMGMVMKQTKGKADNGKISGIIKQKLMT